MPRTAPDGFVYTRATEAEVDDWKRRHNGLWPRTYRLECTSCGRRIWGSGLAIGSHRRACKGSVEAAADPLTAEILAALIEPIPEGPPSPYWPSST